MPLALLLGCATEREAINRVQANALHKSFFVGQLDDGSDDPEFYMRVSVVDVDVGAGAEGLFTNSDSQPVTRIRWEIAEDLLIARLTYELVEDTDFKGVKPNPAGADGQIVAAYEIDKHFDIRHDYNPSTGEEYNVIGENETDRPWYSREYFRVDWSRNLVTTAYDLDTLSQLGMWYAIEWEPVAYYVSDSGHPDAPVFDTARGYFDVTNKAYAKPLMVEDEWWGDFPACWLYGHFPYESCNPSELTLRQSFLRVVDTDYEPMHYDGTKMDLFGYFTVDRFGYDRGYGVVDDKWHRFITRWNVFERSHATPEVPCARYDTPAPGIDPHRDENADGTEDECEAVGSGSRCDEFKGLCTLPFRQRPVRTIVWHTNPGFPDELFASAEAALMAWNDALRAAIVAGRLAECRRTGDPDCELAMAWPSDYAGNHVPPVGSGPLGEVPQIFVLCHNPVSPEKGDDVQHCGPAGTASRLGDLRYNFLNIIQDPEWVAPWGIMVDAWDPLTGEVVAGSVNMWGSTLDRAAASVVDLVELLNGHIDPEQYIAGQNVSEWVRANRAGGMAERGGTPMSAAELASRRGAFDPQVLTPYLAGLGQSKPHLPPWAQHSARAHALIDHGRLGPGNAALWARLAALRGSPLEAQLVSPDMAQAAGYDPTAPTSAQAIVRGSPFGRMNPAVRRDERRRRRLSQARRHACRLEGPDPDSLLGLARTVQRLFTEPEDPNDPVQRQTYRDQIYQWVREQYTIGVLAHELGHSMGLRHNFSASFDALNYDARYWQLRTHNGEVTQPCPDGTTDGTGCLGPRWRDPLNEEELDGNIGRYAVSSVMDYPGDANQDMLLPGKYDRAAVRFG